MAHTTRLARSTTRANPKSAVVGSSTAQPAHKPLAPISRRNTAAGRACLKAFYGLPQESPQLRPSQAWRAAVTARQYQCRWPSPTGMPNTARTTAACPGEKHLTFKNSHTPSKQPPSCLAAAGCFEAFLEKTRSFQPTLGCCSPASLGTALVPALPSAVSAPIRDPRTLHSWGGMAAAAAAARGSGTHHGTWGSPISSSRVRTRDKAPGGSTCLTHPARKPSSKAVPAVVLAPRDKHTTAGPCPQLPAATAPGARRILSRCPPEGPPLWWVGGHRPPP